MKRFNEDFLVGAATAAHQVEGNNIYSDYWVQENIEHSMFIEPSFDAVDHYNRYEEDIKMLADAGLNSYRFSIEWARIQPEKSLWIQSEVDHYKDVISCCKKYGINPMVTLHHFSSPIWVITDGGWENPDIVNKFAYYVSRLIKDIGSELTHVCTINEANMRLQLAALIKNITRNMESNAQENKNMESDVQVGMNFSKDNIMLSMIETAKAFGISDPRNVHTFLSQCTEEGDILVMKAHEAARDSIKEHFPNIKVGLTLSLHDLQALDGGEIHVNNEWNDEFLHYLPYIQNDDFLGVQCYSRKRFDCNGVVAVDRDSSKTQMGYEDYPIAIANVVRKVSLDYKGELIVTENGIATADDVRRCDFIEEATAELKCCIDDGVRLIGYYYWSLLDNFEWQKGYGMTFGLISVDRSNQKRTPKRSLSYLGTLGENL